MSLKNILTCYERISYTASIQQPLHVTEMKTIAEIEAHGRLSEGGGMAARKLGRRMEEYSMNRYISVAGHFMLSIISLFYKLNLME